MPCSWIGSLNIIKVATFPKLIHRFNTVPIKIPAFFFFLAEIHKLILKFICKCKGLKIAKLIFKKKNKHGDSQFLISKLTIKLQ